MARSILYGWHKQRQSLSHHFNIMILLITFSALLLTFGAVETLRANEA